MPKKFSTRKAKLEYYQKWRDDNQEHLRKYNTNYMREYRKKQKNEN